MHRRLIASISVLLALIVLLPLSSSFAIRSSAETVEAKTTSRLINIVYDDSNSMLVSNRKWWCYAKYSLEIFSAMMQENDTMNIYYMSDYYQKNESNAPKNPRISNLSGKSSLKQSNIDKIRSTVTKTMGTPFISIKRAYENLQQASSSYTEKWLVIITDGDAFDNKETDSDLNNLFASASGFGMKVVYLAIGSDLVPRESSAVSVYKADGDQISGNKGILTQVTKICERIFQRPELKKVGNNSITIDVPCSEIIILAQGKNVNIGEISGTKRSENSAVMDSKIDPQYATDNEKYKKNVVADDLNGRIFTFIPSNGSYIAEGTYSINLNAEQYTVYYKPCLEVVLKVIDKSGNVMLDKYIPIGQYDLDYYLTYPEGHPKYGEKIDQNLFSVDYEVTCTVKGDTRNISSKSVDLKEGETTLEVEATYLAFISDSVTSKYVVEDFTIEQLTLELDYNQREYRLTTLEKENEGITVSVLKNGSPLSSSDWERFNIAVTGERIEFKTVKNDNSTFTIYPAYNTDIRNTATGDVPFNVSVTAHNDHRQTDAGNVDGSINIYDDFSSSDIIVTIHPQDEEYNNKEFADQDPQRSATITWNGNHLTKEQYDNLVLEVDVSSDYITATAEKSAYDPNSDVSAIIHFNVVRDSAGNPPSPNDLSDTYFKLRASVENEGGLSRGEASDELKIVDARSFWEKLLHYLPYLIALAALLYLLFAYLTKRYLPKKIIYIGVARFVAKPYKNSKAVILALLPIPFIRVKSRINFMAAGGNQISLGVTAGKKGRMSCSANELKSNNLVIDRNPRSNEIRYKASTISRGNAILIRFQSR